MQGKRILIVGVGNSGFEIGLNCVENDAKVELLARGEQHVASITTLTKFMKFAAAFGLDATPQNLQKQFCYTWNDTGYHDEIKKMDGYMKWMSTDLSKYGLKTPSIGPFSRAFYQARIPTYDWGLIPHIQSGKVKIRNGTISKFVKDGVEFDDGKQEKYDIVIFATGFRHGLQELFTPELCDQLLTDQLPKSFPPFAKFPENFPKTDGRCHSTVIDSLYFAGFDMGPYGGLYWGVSSWYIGERLCLQLGILKPEQSSIKTEPPKSFWSSLFS